MCPESFSPGLLSIVTCLGVRLVKTRGPRPDKGPGQLLPIALQILQVAAGHKAEDLRTKRRGDHVALQAQGCSRSGQLRALAAEDGEATGWWRTCTVHDGSQ